MKKNIYTVIPARGGSKSIPRKNIKIVQGYPLIKYSIDYSIESNLISKTVVSTDDDEIAKISKNLGASVPFIRPSELAEDDTEDFPVIEHALNELESIYSEIIDIIVLLRPTSPLRPPKLIERGLELLAKNPSASSVRAVTLASQHPFRQWMQEGDYIKGFSMTEKNPEPFNKPRQILPQVYFQTGDIELIKRETIKNGSVSGSKVLPLIIEPSDVFDIDNLQDLKKAEEKFEKEHS